MEHKNQFLELRESITSWDCLLGLGLELIFHWKTQWFILVKSSFKFCADNCLLRITEKKDVSSANNLGFETKFSGKSFMYIKKSNGPRIQSWGTPASSSVHVECWPLTLCSLSLKKLVKVSSKSPATTFRFSL